MEEKTMARLTEWLHRHPDVDCKMEFERMIDSWVVYLTQLNGFRINRVLSADSVLFARADNFISLFDEMYKELQKGVDKNE